MVVIAGETGSGKTTQLPKYVWNWDWVKVLWTYSTTTIARSVATRIAEKLNTPLSHLVGYKVRFSDQISEHTQIKLMTDGILLAEIQQDRFLNQYDTLIIDEAHERKFEQ